MQSTVPSVNNKNKKRLPSFLVMLLMQAPKLVTPHLQNKYQAPSPTCSTSSHLHTIHIHTYHFTYHHHKMAQHRSPTETEGLKTILPEKSSPSTKSQILAAATGFPLGGFLLLLSGLTLSGTLIGLALATPLFIIFSPVLVPAALTLAMAVFGFLTTGVFGITALHALSWIVNYLRNFGLDQARQRVQDRAGQKTLTLHTI